MNSIANFIIGLNDKQKAIVVFLHQRLTDHHGLRQDMKYDIPMYAQKKWICYLNPIKKNGIELAFVKGHLLSNEQKLLDRKKRKYVAGIDVYDLSQIREKLIDEIVQEALLLDEFSQSNSTFL
ncbi:MAG: DUF1801 domain-containing protein [Ekhidna sp.]